MMYKIRLKSNPDQYVRGTPSYISTDKQGRIFQTLGRLRMFLNSVMSDRSQSGNISNWEIVELEVVIKEVKGVHEIITPEKLAELLKR